MHKHRKQDFELIIANLQSVIDDFGDVAGTARKAINDLRTLRSRLDETCEGYCNRETHAAAMFLNNSAWAMSHSQSLLVISKRNFQDEAQLTRDYADEIKAWFEYIDDRLRTGNLSSITSTHRKDIKEMFSGIGSLWRVDWIELAEDQMAE